MINRLIRLALYSGVLEEVLDAGLEATTGYRCGKQIGRAEILVLKSCEECNIKKRRIISTTSTHRILNVGLSISIALAV